MPVTQQSSQALWVPHAPEKTQIGLFKIQIEKQFECQFDDYAALHQ